MPEDAGPRYQLPDDVHRARSSLRGGVQIRGSHWRDAECGQLFRGAAVHDRCARLRLWEGGEAERRDEEPTGFGPAIGRGVRVAVLRGAGPRRAGRRGSSADLALRAYEERSHWLVYLKAWPLFDELRADRRFAVLLGRVGLP